MNVDTRLDRKRLAAQVRREIRLLKRETLALASALSDPGADVYSLGNQLISKAEALQSLQRTLNATLNRAEEVAILKGVAKRSTKKKAPKLLLGWCRGCGHLGHLREVCEVLVTDQELGAGFTEICGCRRDR